MSLLQFTTWLSYTNYFFCCTFNIGCTFFFFSFIFLYSYCFTPHGGDVQPTRRTTKQQWDRLMESWQLALPFTAYISLMLGLLSEGHTQYLAYTYLPKAASIPSHTLKTERQRESGRGRWKRHIDLRRLMVFPLDFNERDNNLLGSMKESAAASVTNSCWGLCVVFM